MHNSLEVLLDSLIRNLIEALYSDLLKNNSIYNQFSSDRTVLSSFDSVVYRYCIHDIPPP
jgi:hypothetical protein